MKNIYIKFSILIPAYKDKFLFDCISSIFDQTYKNFEIIIVDDASPYKISDIINSFSDSRIHYYRNNVGYGGKDVVKNWNECLKHSTGDYVMCIGDDDKLLPNCLSDYMKLIEKYPDLDLYHMRTEIINEDSKVVDLQEARPELESALSMLFHRIRGRKQYIGDFLFRTSTLVANNGFIELPSGCCSDDITAIFAAKDNGVANSYIPGFQYRDNYLTLTRSPNNMRLKYDAFILARQKYKEFLSELTPVLEIDCKYKKIIMKTLDNYINGNLFYCVKVDIKTNGLKSFCYWMKIRKHANLSIFYLINCLLA